MGQQDSKMNPAVMEDLLNNTSFTQDEIATWYQGFLTKCPSGLLSIDDFKDVYCSLYPNGDASKMSEHVFRSFDADSSGTIDFREFLCALSIATKGTAEQKLEWAFSMYDVDRDGRLTREEFRNVKEALNKAFQVQPSSENEENVEMDVDEIFKTLDTNHDGSISKEEFMAAINSQESVRSILTSAPINL